MRGLESDFLKLVVAAAFYHELPEDRALLRDALEQWLGQQTNVLDAEAIRNCITSEQGTPLEPFKLSKKDIDCAVLLAQMAFCDAVGETRLTIVSRETIGERGGLVLSNNLKSFYSERYIYGKNRREQKSGWRFIPNNLKGLGDFKALSRKARIHSGEDGFTISIPNPKIGKSDLPEAIRSYQKCSRIDSNAATFSELGLRVESSEGSIKIQTGSPESIIRVMPALMEERLLILETEETERFPSIIIRLAIPEEEACALKAIYGNPPLSYRWLRCSNLPAFKITPKLIHAVGRWCRPHSDWLSHFTKLL